MLNGEANKSLMRQFTANFNSLKGDTAEIRALYENFLAPNYVGHNLLSGDMNREKRIQSVIVSASLIPDLNYAEEDMMAEDDKVVTRYVAYFTHTGPFMGIPPTGKKISVRGVQINRIVDGKNTETWDYMDYLGLMTQLGAIPTRPSSR
jgi:predicted ester cyclase